MPSMNTRGGAPAPGNLIADERSLFRLVTVSLILTAVVLLSLSVYLTVSYRRTQAAMSRQLALKQLIGTISHLDEVLTMSARMAALTGDFAWETRYRHFEPKLDGAIKEAISVSSGRYGGEAAAQTDAANLALVQLERRAFEGARQGKLDEARAVLFSREYEEQKRIYSDGMAQLTVAVEHEAAAAMDNERRRVLRSIVLVVLALPFLLVAWLAVSRAIRKSQAALLDHQRPLETQAAQLFHTNQLLDQRVAERTRELSRVNESLTTEAAERVQVEQALRQKLVETELLNKAMTGREERILELKEEIRSLQARIASGRL